MPRACSEHGNERTRARLRAPQGGSVARSTFSMGCLHTTQMGRGPRSTRIEQSVHMAMWPHGTSKAERGSSKQTAHGSAASASSASKLSAGGEAAPEGSPDAAAGPAGEPTGEEAQLFSGEAWPDFLRMPRLGRFLIGSGQRSRCRDW